MSEKHAFIALAAMVATATVAAIAPLQFSFSELATVASAVFTGLAAYAAMRSARLSLSQSNAMQIEAIAARRPFLELEACVEDGAIGLRNPLAFGLVVNLTNHGKSVATDISVVAEILDRTINPSPSSYDRSLFDMHRLPAKSVEWFLAPDQSRPYKTFALTSQVEHLDMPRFRRTVLVTVRYGTAGTKERWSSSQICFAICTRDADFDIAYRIQLISLDYRQT